MTHLLKKIKTKINKWDLIKPKSFAQRRKLSDQIRSDQSLSHVQLFAISKVKRQLLELEKITANEATDKQLISKIYKQHLQLSSRKINDPNKK